MARAISRSCSSQRFCARRDCRCRHGWSANRASAYRTRRCSNSAEPAMPTECLFRDDAYLRDCRATVLGVTHQGGLVLDKTVFYATSGGQPGDRGVLAGGGRKITIATAVYGADKSDIVHVPADGQEPFLPGENVE